MKANQGIRNEIFVNGLKYWQVAKKVGITDSRFSVWLRTPLDDLRKERVEKAIDELLEERKVTNQEGENEVTIIFRKFAIFCKSH